MAFLEDSTKNYSKILESFKQNKDKDLFEWVKLESFFPKQGKQGITGIFSLKDDPKKLMIFKVSQYLNYTPIHESLVMNGLNSIYKFCPHFCRSFGTVKCKTDPNNSLKDKELFNINKKIPVEKDILLMEYIEGRKFYNYFCSKENHIIFSIIKQVLLAVYIAQKEKKFTHYDLHADNIIIKKCDPETVFVYVLDEENQFCVPTYGYYPVIIDFGFSYISDMEDEPFWNTFAHTDVNFFIDRFEWLSDPKLFLISSSDDMNNNRNDKYTIKFKTLINNLFKNLDINRETGWDVEKTSVITKITNLLKDFIPGSPLFINKDYLCFDIIQSLIVLPLERQKYTNIETSYAAFISEFLKIEIELNSEFYSMYLLKNIVDIARDIRPYYLNKNTQKQAIDKFKDMLFQSIYKIAKFCKPKDVNYEVMLCSLLLFSNCLEGLLYDMMIIKEKKKQKDYNKLEVKNILEIYGIIERIFPSKYIFNNTSIVLILDSIEKDTNIFNIDNIEELNDISEDARGCYIYDKSKID